MRKILLLPISTRKQIKKDIQCCRNQHGKFPGLFSHLPFQHVLIHSHHVYIRVTVPKIQVYIFVEIFVLHLAQNKFQLHVVHLVGSLHCAVDHSTGYRKPAKYK